MTNEGRAGASEAGICAPAVAGRDDGRHRRSRSLRFNAWSAHGLKANRDDAD
jgi:hypothetical protein